MPLVRNVNSRFIHSDKDSILKSALESAFYSPKIPWQIHPHSFVLCLKHTLALIASL